MLMRFQRCFVTGLARCGKSCRLRWLNYLRPNLKHGNYTLEEEKIIIKLHQEFGNKYNFAILRIYSKFDSLYSYNLFTYLFYMNLKFQVSLEREHHIHTSIA